MAVRLANYSCSQLHKSEIKERINLQLFSFSYLQKYRAAAPDVIFKRLSNSSPFTLGGTINFFDCLIWIMYLYVGFLFFIIIIIIKWAAVAVKSQKLNYLNWKSVKEWWICSMLIWTQKDALSIVFVVKLNLKKNLFMKRWLVWQRWLVLLQTNSYKRRKTRKYSISQSMSDTNIL